MADKKLTSDETTALIKEVVGEFSRKCKDKSYECHLKDVGISADTHKQHHLTLSGFLDDCGKIKTAFLIAIVTAAGGGLCSIIWLGIKAFLASGGGN